MYTYINLPQGLPPLGWLPQNFGAPAAYPLSLDSAQSYARPPISRWVDPFPINWSTMGIVPLQPLIGTFAIPGSALAPIPSSFYFGGDALNVVGGQSFGFADINGLVKEP